MMDTPKPGPAPFTKDDGLAEQEMTYDAAVMGSNHECDQNGLVRDCNRSGSPRSETCECNRAESYG